MANFSESKTIALIQEIYKGAGVKTMNYTKLIKILYLCDRQMYKIYKRFITGDTYVSMKSGPVLSNTYDLIVSKQQSKFWEKHLAISKIDRYSLDLVTQIDNVLSEPERMIAHDYGILYKDTDSRDTIDAVHIICREWKKPNINTSIPITIEEIEDAIKVI